MPESRHSRLAVSTPLPTTGDLERSGKRHRLRVPMPISLFILHLLFVNGGTVAEWREAAIPPPPPAIVASAPVSLTNYLRTDDGSVSTPVGWYGDASGVTPVGRGIAYVDGPASNFIGHNPGVLTGLFNEHVGSTLTYFDSNQAAHHYRVISIVDRARAGNPSGLNGGTIELQTCLTADGGVVRILTAIAI